MVSNAGSRDYKEREGQRRMDPEDQGKLVILLRRLRDGDDLTDAERAWVDAHTQHLLIQVRRYCRNYLRQPQRAEDAGQDAWMAMFSKIETFDPSRGTLAGWLLGFAHKKCLVHQRGRPHSLFEDDVIDPQSVAGNAYRLMKGAVQEEVLRAAAASLEERDRVLLMMRYLRDLPVKQIAEAMDMKETTAHYRLRELRERFQAGIDGELREKRHGYSLFKTTI